jgi:hypothetical protein
MVSSSVAVGGHQQCEQSLRLGSCLPRQGEVHYRRMQGMGLVETYNLGLGIALGLAIRSFDELPRRRAMQACGAAIGLIGTGLTIGLV